ncbi:hypothetical protein [Streptomyces sp. H51]|uniref:hypothetical protein n=1 Tax=Streptomyces sp. H51 TaxID=3111770 RepID=UPI002D78E637|nr:hypothetical protein [Streptomyces sp. H51]
MFQQSGTLGLGIGNNSIPGIVCLDDDGIYALDDRGVTLLDLTHPGATGTGRAPKVADLRCVNTSVEDEGEKPVPSTLLPAADTPQGPVVLAASNKTIEGAGTTPDAYQGVLRAVAWGTGAPAWQVTWPYKGEAGGYERSGVVGVAESATAVVVLGGAEQVPTTFGIDLASHKVVWQKYGFEAQVIDGSVVVGRSTDDGYWDDDGLESMDSTLLGLDAATGRQRWSALAGSTALHSRLLAPDRIWTTTSDPDGSTTETVLSTDEGRDVGLPGIGGENRTTLSCLYDGRSVLVCSASTLKGYELSAIDTRTGKRLWVLGGPDDTSGRKVPGLAAAWHGAVYCSLGADDETREGIVLDARTGEGLETTPGAVPRLVNAYGGLVAEGAQPGFYPAAR